MAMVLHYPTSRFEAAPWIDLRQADERAKLTPAVVRSMVRLAAAWNLTVDQICTLLGGVAPSTWHSWAKKPPRDLGIDRLTRASYLLGIYTALHVLYPGSRLADEWIKRPNSNVMFGGQRPLDVLLSGGITSMEQVRTLLDSRRGGS